MNGSQPSGGAPPAGRVHGRASAVLLGARLGFEMALARFVARRVRLPLSLGLALTLASAWIEVSVSHAGAVDRALLSTFRLIIPLTALSLAAEAADRNDLREAAWQAARFGASRRHVAFGIAAAAALVAGAAAALFAIVSVVAANTASAPPLARDALVSGWVGALTGAAYAGWFSLGGTFLRRGLGRLAPLAADLLLGGTTGVAGALLPHGNALNLLGGPAPLGLAPHLSAGLLAGSAIVLSVAAAARCGE